MINKFYTSLNRYYFKNQVNKFISVIFYQYYFKIYYVFFKRKLISKYLTNNKLKACKIYNIRINWSDHISARANIK